MSRSRKLDFATAPDALIADLRARATERNLTPSAAVREALAAWLGRPAGPTAEAVIAELERAGLASPAVERVVKRVMGARKQPRS